MKAAILAAVLLTLAVQLMAYAFPLPKVCTPNAQNQLVCLSR